MSDDQLTQRQLTALAESLQRDGAELVALLPCEPAVGDVAVAFWKHDDEAVSYELLRLADGGLLDDPVALREAFTLLAMTETLEELASFEASEALADQLEGWVETVQPGDAALKAAIARGAAALRALSAIAPDDTVRVARPQLLDQLGGGLRALEQAWMSLEQAAVAWSDAQLDASGAPIGDARTNVPALWKVLGEARKGALRQPAGAALKDGREAGLALAKAATGA
ncbi:MAG: hypothetical protein JWO69_1471 [Thermoleophilia bacterium]|jgi:hypothetical protein|nr:hypothetical protein [Thermoleophilia bacterium]